MKVIFLAFANSSTSPLEFLTEEDKGLNEILSERYELGDYMVHKESFATPKDINRYLDKYKDNLCIFHFSGHAGRDNLLVNDQLMYSSGIAAQLRHSAAKGVLKLVVLNGCSTRGQVKALMENGVPAVVSTSAPVNDQSAKEFSMRFWQKLVKEQCTIEEAFQDALAPAQAVTKQNILQTKVRHLVTEDEDDRAADDLPLWRLDGIDAAALKVYPIPYKEPYIKHPYIPNEKLLETLYNSYLEAENPEIMDLHAREQRGSVSDGSKQIAIVNSIPFPIGTHLQKLVCPISETDEIGYDQPGLRRLEQIAQLFQITTEFLGIIMIAQIWEISIRFAEDFVLDDQLKSKLQDYLQLDEKSRETYEYIPLIQSIRVYLEQIQTTNTELRNFIDEQEILKDLVLFNRGFEVACEFLSNIRKRVIDQKISEEKAAEICIGAENELCIFIKPLGFIHRYHLTSVQNIDILKLRHITKNNTEYKHRIIRCMQAIGKDEWNYYYMETFLDNWGVILLKCDVARMKGKNYKVKVIDYLNLSPFVIDRNSFVDRTDLANIMFFKGEDEKTISFKRVKNPLSQRDAIIVSKQEDEKDKFDPIRLQYNAFKAFIA